MRQHTVTASFLSDNMDRRLETFVVEAHGPLSAIFACSRESSRVANEILNVNLKYPFVTFRVDGKRVEVRKDQP